MRLLRDDGPKELPGAMQSCSWKEAELGKNRSGEIPTNRFGNFVNFCSPFTAGEQRVPTFSKSGSKIGSAVLAQRGSSSTEGMGDNLPLPSGCRESVHKVTAEEKEEA